MCASRYQLLRAGVAAVTIGVCAAASAEVVRVYEWSENGGTPVISGAPPPASVKQYTMQTVKVPALSADQRARIQRSLAADRAALDAPVPPPAEPVTLALHGDSGPGSRR